MLVQKRPGPPGRNRADEPELAVVVAKARQALASWAFFTISSWKLEGTF
jgi:hypothetical protein